MSYFFEDFVDKLSTMITTGVRDYTVLFVIPHVKKYNKKHQLISHEFFFSKIYSAMCNSFLYKYFFQKKVELFNMYKNLNSHV